MNHLTPDDIADRLENPKPTGQGYQAQCPVHDDGTPSLSVSEGHAATVIFCHAGCAFNDICEALAIRPEQLFHNYDPRGRYDSRVDEELRRVIESRRPKVDECFLTVGDIIYEALSKNGDEIWFEGLAHARVEWPELVALPYTKVRAWRRTMAELVSTFLDPWLEREQRFDEEDRLVSRGLVRVRDHWKENYGR